MSATPWLSVEWPFFTRQRRTLANDRNGARPEGRDSSNQRPLKAGKSVIQSYAAPTAG
jgi:hypothetical protein